MINIALTNLGKYNEGELVYEWLSLPATNEEIQATLNNISINGEYEEYFISDYETATGNIEIGEYESIDCLNKLADTLEGIKDLDKLTYLMDEDIITEKELIESDSTDINTKMDEYSCLKLDDTANNEEALAIAYIEEVVGGLGNLSQEELMHYFDYEKYGEDLVDGGAVISTMHNVALI